MGKLDINVETYRVVAETLLQLRATTRALLRACYGEAWEERGVPELLRGFLDQRRVRESSIQWRLLETVDLLDFAGFENIADIITASTPILDAFAPVSPDAELLRARFIELDSVQARVAFARPVTESEMEFVVSFSERLRKVRTELSPAAEAGAGTPTRAAATSPKERARRADGTPPAPAPKPPAAAAGRSAAAPDPVPARVPGSAPAEPPAGVRAAPPGKAISATELAQALDAGNVGLALTALYGEVTRVAELLWEEGIAGQAPQWELVRESRWYHQHFSRLGLKALSDFYDIHRDVGEQVAAGASRTQIQEMLQERRFGEVLIALRELFRRHLVEPGKGAPAVS